MTIRTLSEKTISTLFEYLEQQEQYVFLDTSKPDNQNRQSLLFVQPIEQLQYRSGEDRDIFLEKLLAWKNRGYYLAGWIGYEFLHDFLIKKKIQPGTLLVDLGVYKEAMIFDHVKGEGNFPVSETMGPEFNESGYGVKKLVPSMEKHDYCQAIEKILEYIAAGDTYQVNYTFKFSFDFSGSVSSFYQKLRRSQPVPYGGCIKNGNSHIMSFSPELFFRIEDGKIFARPMKKPVVSSLIQSINEFSSNFVLVIFFPFLFLNYMDSNYRNFFFDNTIMNKNIRNYERRSMSDEPPFMNVLSLLGIL